MRSKEQILAEVVDSLIRRGEGQTPPEIGQLAEIGVRLHNECPDADLAFLQRLEQRLRAESAPPGRVRSLLAALSGWCPRFSPGLLRVSTAVLVAAVVVIALGASTPLLHTAQASLSHAVSLLRQARIEELPEQTSTPQPLEVTHTFSSLEEVQAAGYAIHTPAYLPAGLTLSSVRTIEDRGRERLILQYSSAGALLDGARDYVMIQEFLPDEAGGATVTLQLDLSGVERLDVAGRTALWVPWGESPESLRAGLDGRYVLLVQDDDLLIELSGTLDSDESVRIAESMFQ